MDNDAVRAYLAQVDNDYDGLRAAAAAQFEKAVASGQPTERFIKNYAAWREHHAAWKSWLWGVQDDWWLDSGDYNAARRWHELLPGWREKLGPFAESVPSTPVPEKEPGMVDDISSAASSTATPVAVVAGAVLLTYLLIRKGR